MKKNKTKILMGFGVATTLLTTGSVVLSCGMSNQQKQDSITAKMVADYVKTQDGFIPSATADVPTVAHSTTLTNATLNGVSGITITISNWVANATLGSVTFDVSISKTGLTTKSITGVTYDGWYKGSATIDQKALDAVTASMVADYVKTQEGFIPSATADVPTNVPSTTLDNVTLNGVRGLTITISNWIANATLGSVTFDVSLSKTRLTAKYITGVTYGGWITADQKKLNAVTAQMVADYVKTQIGFAPSTDVDVPAVAPSDTISNATLNGVIGITITISNWEPYYAFGSVIFDVSISKDGLITKAIRGVNYGGWYKGSIPTDQKELNAVTAQMVADYVKTQIGFAPSTDVDVPAVAPSDTISNATLNGVSGLTITISNWVADAAHSSVTFEVSLSKTGLVANSITGVTYGGWKGLDHLTAQDIKAAVSSWLKPTSTTPIVDAPENYTKDLTFGALTATVTFAKWTGDITKGSITFSIKSISKGSITVDGSKFGSITLDGFLKVDTSILTAENVQDERDKLWKYDNATKTLTINYGVTEIGTVGSTILWGNLLTGEPSNINLPNTLVRIGESGFNSMDTSEVRELTLPASIKTIDVDSFANFILLSSLKFLGAIPSIFQRILNLGVYSFRNTPTSVIVAGDSGTTQEQWQAWAQLPANRLAFRFP